MCRRLLADVGGAAVDYTDPAVTARIAAEERRLNNINNLTVTDPGLYAGLADVVAAAHRHGQALTVRGNGWDIEPCTGAAVAAVTTILTDVCRGQSGPGDVTVTINPGHTLTVTGAVDPVTRVDPVNVHTVPVGGGQYTATLTWT